MKCFVDVASSIVSMNLTGNSIRCICPLERMLSVQELNLSMNPLENEQEIQIFYKLDKLRKLNIKDTPISQCYNIEFMLACVLIRLK